MSSTVQHLKPETLAKIEKTLIEGGFDDSSEESVRVLLEDLEYRCALRKVRVSGMRRTGSPRL